MKCFIISILYFTIFFCFLSTCRALDVYQFVDSRAYSMGNTLSVLPGFTNPASYGLSPSRCAAIQYVNRYGVKELSTYAGTINLPNKYLDAGLYVSRFGFDAYHETMVGLNVYKKLSRLISLGIRVNYLNLHYSDKESNKSGITGDLGIFINPLDNFNVSVLAFNPLRTDIKIGEEKIEIPVILSVGVSYEIARTFLLTGEIEKDFRYPVVCKFGMEYNPVKQLSVRAGMFGKPFTPSFGVGVHVSQFTVDISFSKHPVLGFRSCCGLQFMF